MRLFNFGRNNRLYVMTPIVSDTDYGKVVGWWTSGRIFGRIIDIYIPKFWTRESASKKEGV